MSALGESIPLSSGGQSPQRRSNNNRKISFSTNSADGDTGNLSPKKGNQSSPVGDASDSASFSDPAALSGSINVEALDAADTSGDMSRQSLAFHRGPEKVNSIDVVTSKDEVIDAMRRRFREMSVTQFQEGEISRRSMAAGGGAILDSDDDDSEEGDTISDRGAEVRKRTRSGDEAAAALLHGMGIRASTIRESTIIKPAVGRNTMVGNGSSGGVSPVKEKPAELEEEGEEGEGDLFEETGQISADTYRDSMNTILRGQRNMDKAPAFITLTILSDGMRHYGNMTLRELTALVQAAIEAECGECAAIPEELLAVSKIKYRDVRRMESILSAHEEPAILVRHHAVFMLLDPVRAVILSDRMIVVVPDGADTMIGLLLSIFDNQRIDIEPNPASPTSSTFSSLISTSANSLTAGDLPGDNGTSFSVSRPPSVGHASMMASTGEGGVISHRDSGMRMHGGHGIAFEIRAFEAVLDTVVGTHSSEFKRVQMTARKTMEKLRRKSIVPVKVQEKMRNMKNALSSLTARVQAHQRAVEQLLEEDADMALMNLTRMRQHPEYYRAPLSPDVVRMHEDIEILMDSNYIDILSLQTELNLLRSEIQSVEDSVYLRLDTSRNRLLIANTQIAALAAAIGMGAFIGSLFGMNLKNNMEESHKAFLAITFLTISLVVGVTGFVLVVLRKSGVFPDEI